MLSNPIPSAQAAVISAMTAIAGAVVAFVPSFGTTKEAVIGALTATIVLGFQVANGLHIHARAVVAAPVAPVAPPPAAPAVPPAV